MLQTDSRESWAPIPEGKHEAAFPSVIDVGAAGVGAVGTLCLLLGQQNTCLHC